MGSVDVLKINHCFKKSENSFSISAEMNSEIKAETKPVISTVHYEIFANNWEDCENYVNALNHISQLVKCKIFAYKNNEKK